jgi:hypothetical protein
MNVLKQIHCSWRQPYQRNDAKLINYFIQYERIDHIRHQVIHNPIYTTHEDEIDVMIYNGVITEIQKIIGIEQLQVKVDEAVLWGEEYSAQRRALFSNVAIGYNFRDIQIRGHQYTPIVNLKTRLWFTDKHNEDVRNYILPLMPRFIDIDHQGPIPSLIQSQFMSREEAHRVLHIDDDIDMDRFTQ